jgi:hypothetical protein
MTQANNQKRTSRAQIASHVDVDVSAEAARPVPQKKTSDLAGQNEASSNYSH